MDNIKQSTTFYSTPNFWTPLDEIIHAQDGPPYIDKVPTKLPPTSTLPQPSESILQPPKTIAPKKVHWREQLERKRIQHKINDKSKRRQHRVLRLQDEATMAAFRLDDLRKDLAKIDLNRKFEAEASTKLAGSQKQKIQRPRKSSSINSATEATVSEFYSDQSGVGDLPSPHWGVRDSCNLLQSKNSSKLDGAPTQKGGKSKFKRLAKWITQQFTSNNGVIDSGATGHFLQKGIGIPTGRASRKVVGMPNGQLERATKEVLLPIDGLSNEARLGDELPSLQHNSLLSVPKFADYGYTTVFRPGNEGVEVYNSFDVSIVAEDEPVLRGWRDHNGLWRSPLGGETSKPIKPNNQINAITTCENEGEIHAIHFAQEHVNSIYHLPSIESRVAYIHACLGFPTKAAMLDAAAAGRLIGIPFATVTNIRKHYPETTATPKGHLDQARQGVRSTKAKEKQQPKSLTKEQDVYVGVWDLKNTTYSDQTGRFPYTSYKNNKYLMVMVEIDSSCILVEALEDRTAEEMQRAYLHLLQRIKRAGVQPKKHVMDNEVSELLKETIEKECKLELVPPGCHRRNVAEVAIKTFKAHFISVLAGLPSSFPLRLWDQLLPQAELTINVLRPSHARPGVSAYTYLFGPFNFSRTPLAPLGCEVQCHIKPGDRGTWAEHTADGWYLGPSMGHYRSFHCYIKATRANRICDTVQFMHKYVTQPALTKEDLVCKAAQDLIKALKGKINKLGDEQEGDLKELSSIFQQVATQHAHSPQRNQSPVPQQQQSRRRQQEKAAEPRVPSPRVESIEPPQAPAAAEPQLIVESGQNMPKRLQRELQALQSDTDHSASAPAQSTRSKTRSARSVSNMARAFCTAAAIANCCVNPRQAAARQFPLQTFAEMANAVLDVETGELLEYRALLRSRKHGPDWSHSSANEFGRLAQGIGGRIKNPTNTIVFINKEDVPPERFKDTTYGKFVCVVRPQKAEPKRTRLTIGGNRINYPGEVGTPTADMLLVKIMLNSVVSTMNAKFMSIDISNFYLNTPLPRYEYLKLKLTDIPAEVVEEYQLMEKVTADGHVFVEVRKGMYGLPQAGLIAQELLEKRLNDEGYFQSKIVPGLWTHAWRPISFTLVVDDFGVKYVGEEHAQHLVSVLEDHYDITTDWKGEKYIGLTLDWDYDRREVHLSMPGYIKKARKEFGHEMPRRKQDSPYPVIPPKYGAKAQYPEDPDNSPLLDKEGKHFIQRVNGKFLYLGRAVDLTILAALSTLASQQASPTEETEKRAQQLLDYLATQEEAVLTYRASNMILAIHSDASYLSERAARSRVGGHFFLSKDDPIPADNGAILTISTIIKAVMTSAAEAELGGLYINAREAVYIRQILEALGHKQPRTPIQTDNSTAEGIINNKILPKATKAMDMRFHWLRCREAQKQFRFFWRPGPANKADYPSKHHPGVHHRNVRAEFLTPQTYLEAFRERMASKESKVLAQ